MNKKIAILLPIFLAVLLSLLNLFASVFSSGEYVLNPQFLIKWFRVSVMFYVLWYSLLWISQVKSLLLRIFFYCSLVLLKFVFNYFIIGNTESLNIIFFVRVIVIFSLFRVIQYALNAQSHITQLQLEKEKVLNENYKMQLQTLRSRIDPHFLFNSLNTLRTMVRYNHQNSEKFVMSLSDFYRKTLKFNEPNKIPLEDELEVLKSYLFLMGQRNSEALHFIIDVDEVFKGYVIPTLSLQIVIENCFKHNYMTSKEPLTIKLYTDKKGWIVVENTLQPKLSVTVQSGYGLENIQDRYKLLGIENGLEINHHETIFQVKLKLLR